MIYDRLRRAVTGTKLFIQFDPSTQRQNVLIRKKALWKIERMFVVIVVDYWSSLEKKQHKVANKEI